MSTPSTGTCLSCQDSGLSITGNVIGILTLVYALTVGFYWYYNSFKNAERELCDLENILEARHNEASNLVLEIPLQSAQRTSKERLSRVLDRSSISVTQAAALLDRVRVSHTSSRRSRNLRLGRFVASKTEVVAMVEKTEEAVANIRDIVQEIRSEESAKTILENLRDMRQIHDGHAAALNEILAKMQLPNVARRKSF